MNLVATAPHDHKDLGLGSFHLGTQTHPLTYSFLELVRI